MNKLIIILLLSCVGSTISAIHFVGAGRAITKPSEVLPLLNDGDTVEIDAGEYLGDVAVWQKNNITIRGIGGYAHLRADGAYSQGKAIWVIKGNNYNLEKIEFSECSVPDKNGAGIRLEGTNLTVRHCYFHDNEDGILAGDNANSNIIIEFCEFANNGYGDGFSHNLYINHVNSLTFRFNYSHNAKIGHCLKTRAYNNYIMYNRLSGEIGTSSYELDMPNGGNSYVIGNLIHQGPNTDNGTIVEFGAEGLSNPVNKLFFVNNTVVNTRSGGTFIFIKPGADTAIVANNIFAGLATTLNGEAFQSNNIQVNDINYFSFLNSSEYDYRLTESSPVKNQGLNELSFENVSLLPTAEYKHPTDSMPRITDGQIDIGAYEFPTETSVEPENSITTLSLNQLQEYLNQNSSKINEIKLYNLLGKHIGRLEDKNRLDILEKLDERFILLDIVFNSGEQNIILFANF